jgi:hypothetical protein
LLIGAGAEDPGARRAPWEVPELKIQERPPSTLRNINGGPPGRFDISFSDEDIMKIGGHGQKSE